MHRVVRLGDLLLVAIHVRRVAQQVDQVDEGEFVLDRPDLNRRVVSFALDLRHALIAPVLHQRQLQFRSALLLTCYRIAFAEVVADRLAVERRVATHDHAVAVAEFQCLLRLHAQPARIVARLAGGAHARRALIRAPVGLQPGFGAGIDADQIGPHVPDDTVERELRPLAIRHSRKPNVVSSTSTGFAVDDDRRAQPIQMRRVGPPELWILPGTGDVQNLRLFRPAHGSAAERNECSTAPVFSSTASQRISPAASLLAVLLQRDFGVQALARPRTASRTHRPRRHATGRHQRRRAEDARLRAVPDGIVQILESVAE